LKLPVTSTTGRLLLMQHLQDYLLGNHGAGRRVVVFIEEAQGMPIETLEEIRLLSNLETHHHKLLQIVLFGQPELENNLRKRHIRQLKERITHSFYLAPLGASEVAEYIGFRLQAAGSSQSELFDRGAIRRIAKASRGLIRRINILADKAMLAAYAVSGGGALRGDSSPGVGSRHVRAAIGDCEFGQSTIQPALIACYGLFFSVLAVVAVFLWQRFPVADSFPSLIATKAMVAPVMPLTGSGQTVDKESEASSPGALAMAPDGEEKRQKSVQEVSIGTLGDADSAFPPVSDQFFQKNVGLLPEDYSHEDGISDKQAGTAPQKAARTPATSLLDLRRGATAQWLQRVHPDNYTIQLLAASVGDETQLEKFFQRISSESVREKSYICLLQQGEITRWVVLYDEFQGVTPARRALEELPPELRQAQPFIRSLKKVLIGLHTDNKKN